jgi:hypothetical protein
MTRKEGEGAFQVVSSLPASAFRDAVIRRRKAARRTKQTLAAADPASVRAVSPGSSFVVLSAPRGKAVTFRRLLDRVVEEANAAGTEAVWRALDRVEPQPVPADAATREAWRETEAARWAEIRAEWLKRYPVLTAAEMARLAGSSTVNPSALLNGWVEAKRVFGLTQGRQLLYPAFQIGRDGQPKKAFRRLLTALEGKLAGWPLAIWLTRPNAAFDGWATPLDLIERDPEAVVKAAQLEVQEASY